MKTNYEAEFFRYRIGCVRAPMSWPSHRWKAMKPTWLKSAYRSVKRLSWTPATRRTGYDQRLSLQQQSRLSGDGAVGEIDRVRGFQTLFRAPSASPTLHNGRPMPSFSFL